MTATSTDLTPDWTQRGPTLDFLGLDVLWLQLTGTVCNIACLHCFISCGPKNDSHPIMSTAHALETIREGARLGVKEYYFTGGEPFLHEDIFLIIEETLQHGPLTILTNGILIDDAAAARLGALFRGGRYNLDLRVSLDGTTPAENDPIRGKNTFHKILAGARNLARHGVNPIFAVTTVHAEHAEVEGRLSFMEMLRVEGFSPPRIKLIPPFLIGREERRDRGYREDELLQEGDLFEDEAWALQCGSCRMVTAKGVYPCPILIEEEGARMGDALEASLGPIKLGHPACYTCHVEGFSCRS
jgi:MoaA/NifB/PqqE/SkfB family radical SAM enzyme